MISNAKSLFQFWKRPKPIPHHLLHRVSGYIKVGCRRAHLSPFPDMLAARHAHSPPWPSRSGQNHLSKLPYRTEDHCPDARVSWRSWQAGKKLGRLRRCLARSSSMAALGPLTLTASLATLLRTTSTFVGGMVPLCSLLTMFLSPSDCP